MRERERDRARQNGRERELESVEVKDKQKDIKQHVCQQQPTNSNQPTYHITVHD